MDNQKVSTTEYQVSSDQVIGKIKAILREGNVRRIKVKNKAGKTIFDVSLTMGIAGVVLAPGLLVLGVLALLTPGVTIEVERYDTQA
jgi:Domain of unknown function (DUF4342)